MRRLDEKVQRRSASRWILGLSALGCLLSGCASVNARVAERPCPVGLALVCSVDRPTLVDLAGVAPGRACRCSPLL